MADIRNDGTVSLGTSTPTSSSEPTSGRDTTGGVMNSYDSSWFEESFGSAAGGEGLDRSRGYAHYEPAFRYGWESASAHRGRNFDDVEPHLAEGWRARNAGGDWDGVKHATRRAFERAMHVFEGAKDPDARR